MAWSIVVPELRTVGRECGVSVGFELEGIALFDHVAEPLSPQLLRRHEERTRGWDIEFTVISKPLGLEDHPGGTETLGPWTTPQDAIDQARSLARISAQVMVNGEGGYWGARDPGIVDSNVLERAVKRRELGPTAFEAAEEVYSFEVERERLRAELLLAEAVEIVSGSPNYSDALRRLMDAPLMLSERQAKHLLINFRLSALTESGRNERNTRIVEIDSELGPPSP